MRPVLRKAGWLILALIAPELVVFVAWHQFIRAGETAEEMNEALARKLQREKNPQVKSRAQSVPTLGAAKTKKARQAKNSKVSTTWEFIDIVLSIFSGLESTGSTSTWEAWHSSLRIPSNRSVRSCLQKTN
jgi:hypothetical protein